MSVFRNKRHRDMRKKLNQSLDYSNNFAPGQLRKGYYAVLPSLSSVEVRKLFQFQDYLLS